MPKEPKDILRITILHDGDDIITDPNRFALMSAIPDVIIAMLRPLPLDSEISGKRGAVMFQDADVSVWLTPEELMRLAGLRLAPAEYFALKQRHGICWWWHEDFYDPTTGDALQPRGIV